MTDAAFAQEPETDRLTLDGLDPVFQDDDALDVAHIPVSEFEPIDMNQAAILLAVKERVILRLVRSGKLCGRKDPESKRWQIDLHCLRTHLQTPIQDIPADDDPDDHSEPVAEVMIAPREIEKQDFQLLVEKLETAYEGLRDANYQIGYLQSQLDGQTKRLEILPYLQTQSAKTISAQKEAEELRLQVQHLETRLAEMQGTWWSKFSSWMMGRS